MNNISDYALKAIFYRYIYSYDELCCTNNYTGDKIDKEFGSSLPQEWEIRKFLDFMSYDTIDISTGRYTYCSAYLSKYIAKYNLFDNVGINVSMQLEKEIDNLKSAEWECSIKRFCEILSKIDYKFYITRYNLFYIYKQNKNKAIFEAFDKCQDKSILTYLTSVIKNNHEDIIGFYKKYLEKCSDKVPYSLYEECYKEGNLNNNWLPLIELYQNKNNEYIDEYFILKKKNIDKFEWEDMIFDAINNIEPIRLAHELYKIDEPEIVSKGLAKIKQML